ncbi:MAG: phosphatase PAP2 family protein [Paracoccaceae bacterium]|nr:MAG: phosphatase PAP2 family protein [Paracoccaceae bacterium]
MKHAGSQDELLARLAGAGIGTTPRRRLAAALRRQGSLSWLATLASVLMLVAVVSDAPVRDLARALDPSVVAVLRVVTQFGNSAWPLCISLLLLGAVAVVARRPHPFPPAALQNLRSSLLLVIGAVAISGTMASLAKHMIGRARPSNGDALVFEFAVMSFQAGWAAFPSGHATTATACAVALAVALPGQAVGWLSIGLLAAMSRAFVGVHWMTDCLAGMVLGAVVCLALRNRMERHGHTFPISPALPAQVLLKGAEICLSHAWLVAAHVLRTASLRVRQHLPVRRSRR